MEKSTWNKLSSIMAALNGLTDEQAAHVMSRAEDFIAGAAFRERLEAAQEERARA